MKEYETIRYHLGNGFGRASNRWNVSWTSLRHGVCYIDL